MSEQAGAYIQDSNHSASNINLLLAVNEAASLLLTVYDTGNIDDVLESSLEIIGHAMDVDRVHLWRAEKQTDEPVLRRLYTWLSEYGENAPDVARNVASPFRSFPDWFKRFRSGECIGGAMSTLAPDEQKFFSAFEIKTVYLIPLLFKHTLWGLVSIDDCKRERSFSEDELTILKSVSLMVASAINRHEMISALVESNEQADAANSVKNAFLSNMSHELRTPLNAIVGMSIVGRNTESVAEKDAALSKINDASVHLLEIISNVLDMARIEEGKLELVSADYCFRDMLDKILSSIRPLANEKNQVVNVNVDNAIPRYVVGDELRMKQLISNLLTNAVKFTPIFGNIGLDITVQNETNEHLELKIVVRDNGIGISEDLQDTLFVPFEQAQGVLNHEFGGAGLGLPISKRIAELMDGQIWVESESNRGTSVYVVIQLAKSRMGDASPGAADSASESGNDSDSLMLPGEFKGKRLLIVEDIEINREILISLLKKSELIIECAEDGQIALNMVMFNVEKYDIIFMDLQMPNMGGLESARRIRGLPERKRGHLPIIAMTANVLPDDIKACFDAGMDDHLSKPLDIEKVLTVLRKHLSV